MHCPAGLGIAQTWLGRVTLVIQAAPTASQHRDPTASTGFAVRKIIFLRARWAVGQYTRLAGRAGQIIVLRRKFPELGMPGVQVDHRFWLGLWPVTKHPGRALKPLIVPLLDPVGLSCVLCT